MANYQQYQRYRLQPEHKGLRYGKILIILAIVVVLYLIGRALFGGSNEPTTIVSGDNTNSISNTSTATEINTNENTNGSGMNSNANTNINTNSAINNNANTNTATAGSFDLSQCKSVFSRGKTDEKKITLTFNIGTSKEGQIQQVLEALKNGQVAADFFARGEVAENSPDLINKITAAGFPIYNLSYNYPHFNDLPESGVTEQLAKADTAISQRTNKTTKPFFRPPYGEALDSDIFEMVIAAGYCPVTWSVDAMDWSTEYTAEESKERVLSKASNGSIIVMQASNATTAEIISDLITQLKTKGYSFVHLEELL